MRPDDTAPARPAAGASPADDARGPGAARRGARRLLWAGIALVLAVAAAAAIFFIAEPMTVARWLSRRALGAAGLEEADFAGPAGRIHYWTGGAPDGALLVLVHGMGDNAGTWNRVVAPLALRHRLVVLDLPGHGASEPRVGPLPFALFHESILALADHLAPGQPFTLVGNSMGGWVGLRLALERPERLVALWSVDGAGIFRDIRPITLTPATREEARALFEAVSGPRVPRVSDFFIADYLEKVRDGATPRVMAALRESDLLDARIGEVRVPVHLVWGADDDLLPVDYAERLRTLLPAATLDVLPRCGHVPQMECPQEFLDVFARRAEKP